MSPVSCSGSATSQGRSDAETAWRSTTGPSRSSVSRQPAFAWSSRAIHTSSCRSPTSPRTARRSTRSRGAVRAATWSRPSSAPSSTRRSTRPRGHGVAVRVRDLDESTRAATGARMSSSWWRPRCCSSRRARTSPTCCSGGVSRAGPSSCSGGARQQPEPAPAAAARRKPHRRGWRPRRASRSGRRHSRVLLRSRLPRTSRRADPIAIDIEVAFFAIALAALTAAVCGAFPARQAPHRDLRDALASAGRRLGSEPGQRRLRSGLLAIQVTLAFLAARAPAFSRTASSG